MASITHVFTLYSMLSGDLLTALSRVEHKNTLDGKFSKIGNKYFGVATPTQ